MMIQGSTPTRKTITIILLTGLFVGVLDGIAAEILYFISGGKNPLIVFQYIASGMLGRAAFNGGAVTAACGVVLHLVIAFSWTSFFFLIYPRIPLLSKKKVLAGVLYGLVIWLVMNLVVLRLSRVRQQPLNYMRALTSIIVLMVAVGIPVSLSAHKFYSKRTEPELTSYGLN